MPTFDVPDLALSPQIGFILDLGVAVALALVGGAVAVRLRQPPIASTTPITAMIGPSTDHVVVLLIGLPCTAPNPCRVNSTPNNAITTPSAPTVFRMVAILPDRAGLAINGCQ